MNFEESKSLIDRIAEECTTAVDKEDTIEGVSKLAELEALLGGLASYVYRRKEGHIERLRGKDLEKAALYERKAKEALQWLHTSHADPEHRRQVIAKAKANNART